MAEVLAVKEAIEAMKKIMEVYKDVKTEVKEFLGLDRFTESIAQVAKTTARVSAFLDDNEKQCLAKVNAASRSANSAVSDAKVLLAQIKSQLEMMAKIINNHVGKDNHKTMQAAMVLFSKNMTKLLCKIDYVRESLNAAESDAKDGSTACMQLVESCKRIEKQEIANCQAAIAHQRGVTYGTCAAITVFTLGWGSISFLPGALINELVLVEAIQNNYNELRESLRNGQANFTEMANGCEKLETNVHAQKVQVEQVQADMPGVIDLADTVEEFELFEFLSDLATACSDLASKC